MDTMNGWDCEENGGEASSREEDSLDAQGLMLPQNPFGGPMFEKFCVPTRPL